MKIRIDMDNPAVRQELTAVISAALGVSTKPVARLTALDVDGGRAVGFVKRFIAKHGLTVRRVGTPAPAPAPETHAAVDAMDQLLAELADQPESVWRDAWQTTPAIREHFRSNEANYLALMDAEAAAAMKERRFTRHREAMAKQRTTTAK